MIKLLRQNNSQSIVDGQSNEASIHIAHNLHKLPSRVFFADNFRKCATINAFNSFIESRWEYFFKETRL